MPLAPVPTSEKLISLGGDVFDLVLQVASLLPIIGPICFVSSDVKLDETIGHLRGKGTVCRCKHCGPLSKDFIFSWTQHYRL
jgi:hypothetical protein